MSKELIALSASEMRQGLISADFTAPELVKAHIAEIEKTSPEINNFITICKDSALDEANKAQKVLEDKKENSPTLTGIPLAVKDMILTKDVKTTCSSKMLEEFIPPYSATCFENASKAGAILIGKTNHDEFGMGASTEHSIYGPVKNPRNIKRVAGGSSGGSAAAIAANHSPFALSTDTGGSIRQPASFTGVVGLKPTYGRVSRFGVIAFASSLDQVGPHTRTVEDSAMLLEAIAGHDVQDSTSTNTPLPNFHKDLLASKKESLSGLKVGLPKEYFIDGLNPEVEKSVQRAADELRKEGAEIVDISLPHTEHALPVYYILAPAEASSNLARYDGVRYGHRAENINNLSELYEKTRSEGFGEEVKRRIIIGTFVLSSGYYDDFYNKAQQVRTLVIDDFKAAFHNNCDVILSPVCPQTAFELGSLSKKPLEMYLQDVFTTPASLAGLPAISIPYGKDKEELPIGVQLIAAPFKEELLFKVGERLERTKDC